MIINLPQRKKKKQQTWVINELLNIGVRTLIEVDVSFASNGNTFSKFCVYGRKAKPGSPGLVYNDINVYASSNNGWIDAAYRTVTFNTDPTGDLLTWLKANATPL